MTAVDIVDHPKQECIITLTANELRQLSPVIFLLGLTVDHDISTPTSGDIYATYTVPISKLIVSLTISKLIVSGVYQQSRELIRVTSAIITDHSRVYSANSRGPM